MSWLNIQFSHQETSSLNCKNQDHKEFPQELVSEENIENRIRKPMKNNLIQTEENHWEEVLNLSIISNMITLLEIMMPISKKKTNFKKRGKNQEEVGKWIWSILRNHKKIT
jgi:hypothetical protein